MKQNVNYIKHHKNVNMKLIETKLSTTHISLYNALFLLWNNCGFAINLSINRNDVMMLSKIGSNNTYLKCLKDLDNLGFITYKPSHNPLKGSIVNLCRFDTSSDIVVTEFCTTTDTTTESTTAPLYKHLNLETIKLLNNKTYSLDINSNLKKWLGLEDEIKEEETYPTFAEFWDLYDKKSGKGKAEKEWNKLSQKVKEEIMVFIPKYKISQPDKQYRKNPTTFFNQKGWEDEIITRSNNTYSQTKTAPKVHSNR